MIIAGDGRPKIDDNIIYLQVNNYHKYLVFQNNKDFHSNDILFTGFFEQNINSNIELKDQIVYNFPKLTVIRNFNIKFFNKQLENLDLGTGYFRILFKVYLRRQISINPKKDLKLFKNLNKTYKYSVNKDIQLSTENIIRGGRNILNYNGGGYIESNSDTDYSTSTSDENYNKFI